MSITTCSPFQLSRKHHDKSNLAICIATYRRPDGLDKLLRSLKMLRFEKVGAPKIDVFVVDNDVSCSARSVVEDSKGWLPFPIHYEIERSAGIPFARNRLVSLTAGFDLISFVDDDEEVSPQWLDELLTAHMYYDAQVVTGPVLGRYESSPPNWAIKGKFYESSRHSTGTLMNTFFTNNVIIERRLLDAFDKPFEESMAHCGGTDSLLAMRIIGNGANCVWCDDAIVYEHVPASRLTLAWYFRRRFRVGNASVYCDIYAGRRKNLWRILLRSLWLVILSAAVCITSAWRGSYKIVKGLGYLCQAAGIIAATFNVKFNEYGRTDYE